ncbi:hypothetical protein MTX26_26495 [Bradyrhizobium sp. ISRA443]|uniref:hypothetical protein n=1 Tax=unclassified Bradyrhizobium TaxID=2631580 RepID=UPI00247A2482|nr:MULTISPECIES: hypothetical protein [unclassified Bradyrhizobium]WGR97886.1 hypothetical protein MTX23_26485 [Bradyrhizobium sp. ISRA436]WGS04776.1 hypothetical protein MTX18_26495 [Bradyrhizobium sp. ISRA437]WGS11657.1 hypothetical protein MTX26_26495 [Bradyrhizobium sp. ISRA443]
MPATREDQASRTMVSRRQALYRAASLSILGVIATLVACKKDTKALACAELAATSADKSLRDARHYVEQSPDQSRTCRACSFFAFASDAGACGRCQIFNGAANPDGHCDSWAAKA